MSTEVPSGPRDAVASVSEPSATSDMDRGEPSRVLLTAVLSEFLGQLIQNLPGVLDDVDIENLHDFRVAVRRTRSTLKLGRAALPEVMRRRWEPAFKWLGDLSTPVRDLDVYEQELPTMASWLVSADSADLEPFATHLRSRRVAERDDLVRGLRSVRFRRLVTTWQGELTRLADPLEDTDRPLSAGELADSCISRAYKRVMRGGTAISADSPGEDLHELRKRSKELRYCLEVFAPVIDQASGKSAIRALKGLQDVLGRFQDCEVQSRVLRDFADQMKSEAAPSGAMLAIGELIGHLDAEKARARREYDVAFARFARPASQHLMHQLGGGW